MKRAISELEKTKRRNAILAAALDAFYLRGYTATKMTDIAERAAISKGTLYLYFSSKEQMFLAVIETIALPKASQAAELLNSASSIREGLGRIFQIAPMLIQATPLPKVMKVLISDAFSFPEIVQRYRQQVIDVMLAALTALLKRGIASGETDIPHPDIAAKLVIAPMIFSVIWTVVFEVEQQNKLDLNKFFQLHNELLINALGLKNEIA